jgi:predicted hydrocarbon binding protein
MKPEVPIEVDADSGVWSVDAMPMILVPRHFFLNNHAEVEAALGAERYAEILFRAGRKSAYTWCEREAATHGLKDVAVFHHYLKRLSQRGWGRFTVLAVDAVAGTARIRVDHSAFVKGMPAGAGSGRKLCYMFRGWFPGSLEYVCRLRGISQTLEADELHCAGGGSHDHCVFEVRPRDLSAQPVS